jgi:hypothetical protein
MRPMAILGVLLVLAGLYVVFNGASITKDKTVAKVGSLEANVKTKESIPTWAGAVAIVAGIGCIVVGARKV